MSASGTHSSSSSPHGDGSNLPRQPSITQPRLSLSASSANDGGDPAFTPRMRDRQARGKDPYQSTDGSDDNSDLSDGETDISLRGRIGNGRIGKEDFAATERRQKAIAFLENPELLMMYAQSTGDSVAGARYHFTKMMCGYDNADDAKHQTPTAASTSGKLTSATGRGGPLR
ncbi:hypothetical protein B0T22DRAFT_259548 [Podospora appendiculata]|uniref:Uncharacterized protein n=1 Tax=Podospora appendiculata TaxID=314037 RepID=A0AAE0X3G3_9PEZI|nr:hypothetical protein B0T22DRAFT_259548 [Podospora appendiculata]